ncbi:MAG: GNAT family N-acetyltransferase [Candidatus Longimicrobiales bacterium M2_2A_002]
MTIVEPDDVPAVVSVLAEAFHDYPVMRYVLGDGQGYERRLRTLVTFFVMARVLRDETVLGVADGDGLAAAALVSRPGSVAAEPQPLSDLREETWWQLGADARTRYEIFGRAAGQLGVDEDHLHLNMIGVRRSRQGQGIGRRLLEHVHDLSADDPASAGVSLTTEVEENVGLYLRCGYELLGSRPVESAFTTRAMFRPDDPDAIPGPA